VNIIEWLRKKQFSEKVSRLRTDIHEIELHEVEKHTENLRLRSDAVVRAIEIRKQRDPWGQVIAEIARRE
jgi:hypothetical protein